MATFGVKVNPGDFNYVSNELENRGVNYGIWNAEEVFLGTAKQVEFTVENDTDREILESITKKIPQTN